MKEIISTTVLVLMSVSLMAIAMTLVMTYNMEKNYLYMDAPECSEPEQMGMYV